MVPAREHLTLALGVPHDRIPAMSTHVVKGMHLTVVATDDHNRGITHREVFDKIVTGIGNLFYPAHVEPHFAKNPLAFFLEILA
jgi:hypothetical protein